MGYYEHNAQSFFEATVDLDMTLFYQRYLPFCPRPVGFSIPDPAGLGQRDPHLSRFSLPGLRPEADPGARPSPQPQPGRPSQSAQHGLCPGGQAAGLCPGGARPDRTRTVNRETAQIARLRRHLCRPG